MIDQQAFPALIEASVFDRGEFNAREPRFSPTGSEENHVQSRLFPEYFSKGLHAINSGKLANGFFPCEGFEIRMNNVLKAKKEARGQ